MYRLAVNPSLKEIQSLLLTAGHQHQTAGHQPLATAGGRASIKQRA